MIDTITVLAVAGLVVTRLVDILRTALDKGDRLPKAWWLILAHGVGVGVAVAIAHFPLAEKYLPGLAHSGVDQLLYGLGFGSVGGLGHEVLSALSARSGPAPTPKGLVPRP